jgi:hypothetical protein
VLLELRAQARGGGRIGGGGPRRWRRVPCGGGAPPARQARLKGVRAAVAVAAGEAAPRPRCSNSQSGRRAEYDRKLAEIDKKWPGRRATVGDFVDSHRLSGKDRQ